MLPPERDNGCGGGVRPSLRDHVSESRNVTQMTASSFINYLIATPARLAHSSTLCSLSLLSHPACIVAGIEVELHQSFVVPSIVLRVTTFDCRPVTNTRAHICIKCTLALTSHRTYTTRPTLRSHLSPSTRSGCPGIFTKQQRHHLTLLCNALAPRLSALPLKWRHVDRMRPWRRLRMNSCSSAPCSRA